LTTRDLTIRPFQENDCEAAFRLASDLGLSPWTIDDYRDEAKRPDSEMLAAMNGSKLVGFVVGRRVPGSRPDGGLETEIYNIGVAREFQRSGIGSRLIREFVERCRHAGVRDIWLEVRAANAAAIGFYRKFGFSEYAARPNFYRDPPDDAVIMRLTIN
jgi:[ribosomal protein S18]-alanine N-acetyltransferase